MKQNTGWRRYLAMLLACTMLILQESSVVYASEVHEETERIEAKAEEETEAEEAKTEKAEERAVECVVCDLMSWDCRKLGKNIYCSACKNIEDCPYHAPTCICKESKWDCSKGPNPNGCEACSANIKYCEYEPPVCTCADDDFICNSLRKNPNCQVCKDGGMCLYQCFCFMLAKDGKICTAGKYVKECPVCSRRQEECYIDYRKAGDINGQLQEYPGRAVWLKSEDEIIMDETIEVTGDTVFKVHPSDDKGTKPVLRRNEELLDKPLFVVKNGAVLTLDRMEVNGAKEYLTASAPLIMVEQGGTLILKESTSLCNNENRTGMGGGIYCADGTIIIEDTASVKENESAAGGGIYAGSGAQIFVSGAPQIIENSAKGNADNLYLTKKAEKINLDGGLTDGAKISVKMEEDGVFAKKNTEITNRDVRAFRSDDKRSIIVGDNCLEIRDGAVMSGKVTVGTDAVQNALVILTDKTTGEEIGRTYTNKEGIYQMSEQAMKVPCRAVASAMIEDESYVACTDFEIVPDNAKSVNPDIVLEKGYCISGKLSGECTEGVTVTAWKEDGGQAANVETYGNGRYDVVAAEEFSYLTAEGSKNKTAYSGGWYSEDVIMQGVVLADFEMKQGGIGTGYIKDKDGKVVRGAIVSFYKAAAQKQMEVTVPGQQDIVAIAVTDKDGFYRIPSVVFNGKSKPYTAVISAKEVAVCVYVMTGFPGVPEEQIYTVLGEDTNSIALTGDTVSVKGQLAFMHLSNNGERNPQNLKLILRQKNGVKASEAAVDNETGEFELSPVLPGEYFASLQYADNPQSAVTMKEEVFKVGEQGEISIKSINPMQTGTFMVTLGGGFIFVKGSEELSGLLKFLENSFESCKDKTDAEKDEWLKENDNKLMITWLNEYLKGDCSPVEKDMIPGKYKTYLNDWLDYLASKYKVSVTVDNRNENLLKSVETNLGIGEQVTDSARRIAADVVMNQPVNTDKYVNLSLHADNPDYDGKEAIEEAMLSGEVLGFFDMNLDVNYELIDGNAKKSEITETAESIGISVALSNNNLEQDGEYVVLRSHEKDGTLQVDKLPAIYKNGKLSFETDRFSTYAIAYAQPGKGIIIKPSEKPEEKPGQKPSERPGESQGNTKPSDDKKQPSKNQKDSSKNKNEKNIANKKITKISAPKKYEGDSYDSPYLFWRGVQEKINDAEDGETIQVDAGEYELVPAMLIQALTKKNVTLIINAWDGKQIVLNGIELVPKEGVTYYTYEMLQEMMESSESEEAHVLKYKSKTTDSETGNKKDVRDVLESIENRGKSKKKIELIAVIIFAVAATVPLGAIFARKRRKV